MLPAQVRWPADLRHRRPYYNNLDTLAALRGNVRLLTDLYDNPEGVHHAMQQIMAAYAEITEEVCRVLEVEHTAA